MAKEINEGAVNKFVKHVEDINEKLDMIKKYMDNHMNSRPENINYGTVGSASKVSNELDDIMIFLGLKEEN